MRFYAAWAFVVFPPAWAERGWERWWIQSSIGSISSALSTPFARLSFTMRRWALTRKYGKSSSLKCPLTIFGSLILSLLLQQTSILWNTMRLLLLPFAEKRSLWKASSWQPRFCVCQKSGGKCCFCGTTSVTAIRKSGGCLEFAEVQSSTGGKEHCVCCEKKWRR